VTAARLVQDAGDRRAQIEAALALGASPRQCKASVIRRSLRLAMVRVIDSRKTMGIVFLQGVVVVMLLAAVCLTATIVSLPAPAARSRRSSSCGGWRCRRYGWISLQVLGTKLTVSVHRLARFAITPAL